MPEPRKTTKIIDLRDRVNSMIAAEGSTRDGRLALSVLIDGVLMDANRYYGFSYLESEWDRSDPNNPRLRDGYDDSRRFYY